MMGRWTLGRASASPTSTSPCVTRSAGGPVGIAAPGVVRAGVDADEDLLPPFWSDLAAQGWIGLAVDEAAGGEGYGLAEAVVVAEELGRVLAPGPFVASSVAAVALDRFGGPALRPLVADLAAGRRVGTVAVGAAPVPAVAASGGGLVVDGAWVAVLCGTVADVLVLPVAPADAGEATEVWAVVDAADVRVEAAPSLDRTRRVGTVRVDQLTIPAGRVVTCPPGAAGARGVAAVLLAAEGVGMAAWCVATAAEHAVVREQFGRPIGQFQAREAPVRRHAVRPRAGPGGHLGCGPGRHRRRAGDAGHRGRGRHRAPTRPTARPRTASRCSAASASRGSTTPTST